MRCFLSGLLRHGLGRRSAGCGVVEASKSADRVPVVGCFPSNRKSAADVVSNRNHHLPGEAEIPNTAGKYSYVGLVGGRSWCWQYRDHGRIKPLTLNPNPSVLGRHFISARYFCSRNLNRDASKSGESAPDSVDACHLRCHLTSLLQSHLHSPANHYCCYCDSCSYHPSEHDPRCYLHPIFTSV